MQATPMRSKLSSGFPQPLAPIQLPRGEYRAIDLTQPTRSLVSFGWLGYGGGIGKMLCPKLERSERLGVETVVSRNRESGREGFCQHNSGLSTNHGPPRMECNSRERLAYVAQSLPRLRF